MDNPALSKLTAEQLAALDDEQKAVFCMLVESDQDFFARTFNPKDLPLALARKAEIIKRYQADRERLEKIRADFARTAEIPPGEDKAGEILAGAAAALGLGTAAAVAITDNTAFYQGVQPFDLIPPLRTEFEGTRTAFASSGSPEALTATIFLLGEGGRIPAMTINLTRVENGCEVKVNDLSSRSVVEVLKEGGEKLIDLAQKGVGLLRGRGIGETLSQADEALDSGAGLADVVHTLRLKERAWQVIRITAEAIETAYRDQRQKERRERAALEAAWDGYYNCPGCGVSFAPEETVCRVCATARPEKPLTPDPRQT